jgi:Zn-dependent M28 family amino/carboxypeptidase
MRAFVLFGSAVGLLATACATGDSGVSAALDAMTVEELAHHTEVLASDAFEGRGPSSPGEDSTVAYLEREFRALGLEPGNGDSYFQDVSLVSITADPATASFTVRGDGGMSRFRYGPDFITGSWRVREQIEVRNADMVFVGYGIVAPEYGWDDYAGIDAHGKTVVMLVNDPGFATKDTTLFTGDAMTYYGRWTYKFEEASRQGAAAALVIHETEAASYPWDVVRNSWSGEQFHMASEDDNMSRVPVEGWISAETARILFQRAGLDFAAQTARAATREFRAVPLRMQASFALRNAIRRSTSRNVVARLVGGVRPDEHVVYMAHWDHLGKDPTLEGDEIFNGAQDNATGTAGLLLLARAFTRVTPPPKRSVLFLAVTAEEQGLLGSEYYATHPLVPLNRTVAAINMDVLDVYGPMSDITVVGLGQSELDDYLIEAAREQGRGIRPDPNPSAGYYYRSDHFSFAKAGVPALYPDVGVDNIEHGEAWAREQMDRYEAEDYHKPSDEFDATWNLQGAIDDLRLFFLVGYRLANETTWPSWSEDSEFKARRDSMMAAR